jgi:glycosyltransferase involved in cell wall biosynthesis
MTISIVTVVLNNRNCVEQCIGSVLSQTYNNVEYIVIDGGSTDGTIEIVKRFRNEINQFISEADSGIYDAMNKGIRRARGDVVGILNSDDFYADERVIGNVVKCLYENRVDSCYGDVMYVDRNDTDKVVRYWKAGWYAREKFKLGWMPPHPAFFCKRSVYAKYGLLNLDFPLAADYELMLRFLFKYGVSAAYIPKALVKMRAGGTSRPGAYTLGAIRENYNAWKANSLDYPATILLKPLLKILQYLGSSSFTGDSQAENVPGKGSTEGS